METTWKNSQMKKFGWYGLLKNLRFFEPYLYLYFMFNGLTFTQIGLLYAIREGIIYVFEIPSGVFADRYGKRTELSIAMSFYIISFVGFFFATNFYLFIVPMVLFGLGEAFRSGTHKAMIMGYLDHNDFGIEKRQVYGYTRSYSNVGATISSIFSIVLIVFLPNLNILFIIAIVPYILDLLLILSYPSYLNERVDTTFSVKEFLKENVRSVIYAVKDAKRRSLLVAASGFQAVFKIVKDYIQPLIYGAGITLIIFSSQSLDHHLKMYIGLTYAIAQLISVFVTKYAYRLRNYASSNLIVTATWILFAITSFGLGFFETNIVIIVLAFILFYVALNIRKPYMVQKIGDATVNDKRASVLSIESQMTSILIIIFAPLLGFISDQFSIGIMLIVVGILMFLLSGYQFIRKSAQ